jgi:hypothetical protein
MAEVRVYKMISGEEVIAKQIQETQTIYKVENPASIMMTDQGNGTVGVGIAPFMPYSEDRTVEINRMAVAASANPAVEMLNEYNRIYGSGLVQLSKGQSSQLSGMLKG